MSHLIELAPPPTTLRRLLVNAAIDHFGDHIPNTVVETFAELGITDDLIYNANFRRFSGGPKWLNPQKSDQACFRKYIGVRGLGDFSLVVSHPKDVLNYDEVVHSHSEPARWLNDPDFAGYTRFASVRNPVGIINSALFSINALTSEYIQRFVLPEQDNDELRQRLALYKFTDPEFFAGIARFYVRYFDEFMSVRDRFHVMRWEDLITSPAPTIRAIGAAAGVEIDEDHAAEIWQRLDHVNLTGAHKHNYRKGKGKVGDWKNWMTNRHLQILREHGFERVTEAFGYGPIAPLDESAYTPFQRQVDEMMRRGAVYDDYPDRDLFGFAFNKSNLDSSKFSFRRYGWKTTTQVERSAFADEAMMERVWSAVDVAAERVNVVLRALLAGAYDSERAALASIAEARRAAGELGIFMPAAHRALFPLLESTVREAFRGDTSGAVNRRPPHLVRAGQSHNLVATRRGYFVVPHGAGPLDLDSAATDAIPGLVRTRGWNAARDVFALLEGRTPVGDAAPRDAGAGMVWFARLHWGARDGVAAADFSVGALRARRGLVAAAQANDVAEMLGPTARVTPPRPAGVTQGRHLDFVRDRDDALSEAAQRLLQEGRIVAIRPEGKRAQAVLERLQETLAGLSVLSRTADECVVSCRGAGQPDAWLLLHSEGEALADALLDFLDLPAGRIVAPITDRHASRVPLFLISIPKAGTHLLFELARAMSYVDGGTAPLLPQGGHWYYVEYSNSHTVPRDFFVDTVRRSPFGNRMHPFMRSPALFIYRHPLDVLVSEAEYYHKPTNTSFAGYLSQLDFGQRLLRLIDDPWLLGTIRDRVGQYAPWLDCGNVVPVSFEELVGAAGGGNAAMQDAVIWSIQLKLQVAGAPEDFARHAFSSDSPTFRSGQIGAHRTRLTATARERLAALPPDFMSLFGYADAVQDETGQFSRRIQEFRRRPLLLPPPAELPPVLIESRHFGHSIVLYRNCLFAVPHTLGDVDLGAIEPDALARLPHATDLVALKQRLATDQLSRAGEHIPAEPAARAAPAVSAARPAGEFLAYRLFRTDGHLVAIPRAAAPDAAALRFPPVHEEALVGHSRSGLLLRILAATAARRLRRLAARRPS